MLVLLLQSIVIIAGSQCTHCNLVMSKLLLSITPTFMLNSNIYMKTESIARPKIEFSSSGPGSPDGTASRSHSVFTESPTVPTTDDYLHHCRTRNPSFYQKILLSLDTIHITFGPWVQKLNEDTNGLYTDVPIFFMLTCSEYDADDEEGAILGSAGTSKPGVMFGTITYQDYYPSGEIVIECLRYRFKGYKTVLIEYLFAVPFILASSIEDLFIKGLSSQYESLNYTVQLPNLIDFQKVFNTNNHLASVNHVFDSFFSGNIKEKSSSLLNYLPIRTLNDSLHLFKYYQEQFLLKYVDDSLYSYYSYYEAQRSILGAYTYYNYSRMSPIERSICLSTTIKPVLEYTLNGIVYDKVHEITELSVRSLSLKKNSISIHTWDSVSNDLGNQLFLHPYYISSGLVYSLSQSVLEQLANIDQGLIDNNEKVCLFDRKLLRLFEIFDNEE